MAEDAPGSGGGGDGTPSDDDATAAGAGDGSPAEAPADSDRPDTPAADAAPADVTPEDTAADATTPAGEEVADADATPATSTPAEQPAAAQTAAEESPAADGPPAAEVPPAEPAATEPPAELTGSPAEAAETDTAQAGTAQVGTEQGGEPEQTPAEPGPAIADAEGAAVDGSAAAEAQRPAPSEPAQDVADQPVEDVADQPVAATGPEAPALDLHGASASALWDLPPAPAAEAPATEQAPAVETPAAEPPVAEQPTVQERSEPPRRRPTPGPDAAPADQVTAGLPRPPGPGRAARRLAAEQAAAQSTQQTAAQQADAQSAEQAAAQSAALAALAAQRAATQAAIEQALAERAAADRAVEEQVARERARRPAVPIPTVVPDEPRSAAPPRGPAVVVASSNRLRRRVIGGVVALVVLVAAGITALVVTHRGSGPTATTAAPVPDAQLPTVADPPPVLAALSASAPRPDPQVLGRTLAPLLTASALGPDVGAEVVDVASGAVLLDQSAATPATPASTAKLLTSAAVLTSVDPESTLTTKVVAGSAPGEVVLVGGGDPTLTRADTSPDYPGAASVRDLAAQVKTALGGTAVTRVTVDGSLYSGPATASGWQPADAPSTYASPITAAMVDGGRTSATSVNRSGTPATDAGQALATALGVPRATVALGAAPAGARTLGSVHSAPIARIVEQALSQSDNVLAEALARQVAIARRLPATFEGSAQGVLAALRQDGVDVSGVTMVDGSGLSRTDAVPPAVLAGVLTKTASGALPRAAAILSGLAVAGYDGTLADRGDSDPATAPGSVRAKTGTLLGVHGLAGTVVTADGRLLVFALLADHSTSGDAPAERALDQVASALAGCGCR